ncbi:hypothetical protein VTN02DRAFT_1446 [Thermoascus thermophilus]
MDDREASGMGAIEMRKRRTTRRRRRARKRGGDGGEVVGVAATTVADDVYLWQMKRDLAPAGVGSSGGQARPATTGNDGATEPDGPAQRLLAWVGILEALCFQERCWCAVLAAVLLCCAVLCWCGRDPLAVVLSRRSQSLQLARSLLLPLSDTDTDTDTDTGHKVKPSSITPGCPRSPRLAFFSPPEKGERPGPRASQPSQPSRIRADVT